MKLSIALISAREICAGRNVSCTPLRPISSGSAGRVFGRSVEITFGGGEGNAVGGEIAMVSRQGEGPCVFPDQEHNACVGKIHARRPSLHFLKSGGSIGCNDFPFGDELAKRGDGDSTIVQMMACLRYGRIGDNVVSRSAEKITSCPVVGGIAPVEQRGEGAGINYYVWQRDGRGSFHEG